MERLKALKEKLRGRGYIPLVSDVARIFGLGKKKKGRGQTPSRYTPAGQEPTPRDVNRGMQAFANPRFFIIPNDEITQDAIRKIERDTGVRKGSMNAEDRLKELHASRHNHQKLRQRLAWIGANVEYAPTEHAQRFKAEVEALHERYMPVERIRQEKVEPGHEPSVPGSEDFLDEEEKYEDPGLYEDPGQGDAAAAPAAAPASVQQQFQEAQRAFNAMKKDIPIEDRREATLLLNQIAAKMKSKGVVGVPLLIKFIKAVNQLHGPGVGSGKRGGSAEREQVALHTPPLAGGGNDDEEKGPSQSRRDELITEVLVTFEKMRKSDEFDDEFNEMVQQLLYMSEPELERKLKEYGDIVRKQELIQLILEAEARMEELRGYSTRGTDTEILRWKQGLERKSIAELKDELDELLEVEEDYKIRFPPFIEDDKKGSGMHGGSSGPQQHALHTPPLAFRFGKKRDYLDYMK